MAAVTKTQARQKEMTATKQSALGRPDAGHGTIVGTRNFSEKKLRSGAMGPLAETPT
jgi:hypothetical protein